VAYTGAQLSVEYKASERWSLSAQIMQNVQFSEHHTLNLGASYKINDDTRAYGRYEWSDGLSAVSSATGGPSAAYRSGAAVLGFESEYARNASVFSEYRMSDAIAAREMQWANGLRNTWRISDTLRVNTLAERVNVLSGAGQSARSLAVSAEWAPSALWLVAGRLEWRRADDGAASLANTIDASHRIVNTLVAARPGYDSLLDTLSIARKLSDDWTVMVRDYGMVTRRNDRLGKANENRLQAGLAYRDTDTNRINGLFKYEYWVRRDAGAVLGANSAAPDADTQQGFDKHIVSALADWHPSRPWWLTGRVAAKHESDLYADGKPTWGAVLVSGRLVYDITNRIDIGVMASVLKGVSASDRGRQFAYGVEAGYQLQDNVWLSAGYNWRGFAAPDMTGNDYTVRGVYLRLRMKFDEDLFRGRSPKTNPALTPMTGTP
jgi:hypothetical protein